VRPFVRRPVQSLETGRLDLFDLVFDKVQPGETTAHLG
jgi:hypothetical protein